VPFLLVKKSLQSKKRLRSARPPYSRGQAARWATSKTRPYAVAVSSAASSRCREAEGYALSRQHRKAVPTQAPTAPAASTADRPAAVATPPAATTGTLATGAWATPPPAPRVTTCVKANGGQGNTVTWTAAANPTTFEIRYTGIDPDEPSLARARAALPEGRFHLGGIEEFRGEAGGYDHLLSLRSLNHVYDLDLAMARMAELLPPGGSLLLVECTPFAMLREPAQVAAADRAPRAGHQHFRNVASDEVVPLARRHGMVVREHQPSSLATTNQWILLLERE